MKIAPAVMFIEEALDMYSHEPDWVRSSQLREFHSFGGEREQELMEKMPEGTSAMAAGYVLGLETARALLAQNAAAIQAGVSF